MSMSVSNRFTQDMLFGSFAILISNLFRFSIFGFRILQCGRPVVWKSSINREDPSMGEVFFEDILSWLAILKKIGFNEYNKRGI